MKAILLFGPTGVGKTQLLLDIFHTGFEVINADSMQVYRHLDIGTAKPEASLQAKIPHHLIDVINPDQQFNAGTFVTETNRLIFEISRRGATAVLEGGTAFYFTNFLFGLPEVPPGDPAVRKELEKQLKIKGSVVLHKELQAVDPESAALIPSGDQYRIVRALEVFKVSGKPRSAFKQQKEMRTDLDLLLIGLNRPREELYRRIDLRVGQMMEQGLLEEFKGLLRKGYTAEDPGLKAIGYQEFFAWQKNGCMTLKDVADLIRQNSRRYAKRQLTFFRSLPQVQWYHPDQIEEIGAAVSKFLA